MMANENPTCPIPQQGPANMQLHSALEEGISVNLTGYSLRELIADCVCVLRVDRRHHTVLEMDVGRILK